MYVRISKDEAGDELGVKRQEKLCREVAARLGWEVVDVYSDDNLSAFRKGKRRPQYERLMDDIRAGQIDSIVVYNPDRLCRDDLRGLEDLIDVLDQHGVAVETVRSGTFDLSSAHGRAQARMAGVWARLESEKMSERLCDKHAELIAAGKPNGGGRPYGYQRVGLKVDPTADGKDTRQDVPDPAEAPIVREIVERVAAGQTLTAIADDLNARGVPTALGARWMIGNIRRLVTNPRYIGRRTHRGADAGPATYDGLVDEATWRRANALLNDPSRPQRRTPRRYLLGGKLVFCGSCGEPLRSKQMRSRARRVPIYACRPRSRGGCGGVTVVAEPLEQLVREWVIDYVESGDLARALRRRQGGDRKAAAAIERIEIQLEELRQAFDAGAIDLAEYTRFKSSTQQRRVDAQAALTVDTTHAAVGRFSGQRDALRERWESATLDQRQAIVRAVVARVTVSSVGRGGGNTFDEKRVQIAPAV